MQIVIDIPEELYKHTQEYESGGFSQENDSKLFMAIKKGTLLPKGHGRLIDADALKKTDLAPEPWYSPMWGYSEWEVDDADTVLEADKEIAE